jgi:hypothetical protein
LGRGKTFAAFSAITALESLLEMYWIVEYSIGTDAGSLMLAGDCPYTKGRIRNNPVEIVNPTLMLNVFIDSVAFWSWGSLIVLSQAVQGQYRRQHPM